MVFLVPKRSRNMPPRGSKSPLIIVPRKYPVAKLERLMSKSFKRGSVKALKPAVWPGILMSIQQIAAGTIMMP